MKRGHGCPRPDKVAHPSRHAALVATKKRARQLNAAGEHFDPTYGYQCACGKWHTTRLPIWKGRANELLLTVPDDLQAWAMAGHP